MSATPDTLWVARPGRLESVGPDELLWLERGAPIQALSAREAAAWMHCSVFATLEQHAATVAQALELGGSRAQRLLQALIERDLLLRPEQLLADAIDVEPPAASLVLARDDGDPAALAAMLADTATRSLAAAGSEWLLLVSGTASEPLREAARWLARTAGVRVRLLDAIARRVARDRLGAGSEPALASLLDPDATMSLVAALNWGMLLGAGACMSLVEPGNACVTAKPLDGRIELSSLARPAALDVAGGTRARDADDSVRWLGRAPSALVRERGFVTESLHGAPAAVLAPLARATRIAVVARRADDAPSRAQLAWQPDASMVAFDAREPLPFALPFAAGAADFWSGFVRACNPRAALATLPRVAPRASTPGDVVAITPAVEPAAFLGRHLTELAAVLASDDAALRLAALGGYCTDLALADDVELLDVLKRWRHMQLAESLAELTGQRVRATGVQANAMDAAIAAQRAALLDLGPLRAQLGAVRESLDLAGRTAPAWAALWRRARERAAALRAELESP